MAAQKRSNNLIIVLGVLTAVVGAGLVLLLAGRGGDSGSEPAGGGNDTVPVLVAKKPIAQGMTGADMAELVEVRQVPPATRSSDALVSIGELADRTTTVAIGEEQQLRSAFFRQRTQRGDAIKIPEGKQAVPLAIPFPAAGGGYVGPGDRVNVYALLGKQNGIAAPVCGSGLCQGVGDARSLQAASQLVLSNVEVLDISREIAPSTVTPAPSATPGFVSRVGGSQSENVLMLVALDAVQAERAIYLSYYTEIYVTLVPKGQADSATPGRDQTNVLKP